MADLTTVTDFDLVGVGINPFSARGLRGTLSPIALAKGDDKIAYTINGDAIVLAGPQFRKYRLEITGNDQAPPALDNLWVGMPVTVNSLVEVAVRSGEQTSRIPVDGSIRSEGDFSYYRPQFLMLVVDWEVGREEYAQNVPWSLTLTEA